MNDFMRSHRFIFLVMVIRRAHNRGITIKRYSIIIQLEPLKSFFIAKLYTVDPTINRTAIIWYATIKSIPLVMLQRQQTVKLQRSVSFAF